MDIPYREHMTRVKRVQSTSIDQMEETMNAALAELEAAGQEVLSVQFFQPESTARSCTGFVVYKDNAGIDDEHEARMEERRMEISRRGLERSQREAAKRASQVSGE